MKIEEIQEFAWSEFSKALADYGEVCREYATNAAEIAKARQRIEKFRELLAVDGLAVTLPDLRPKRLVPRKRPRR